MRLFAGSLIQCDQRRGNLDKEAPGIRTCVHWRKTIKGGPREKFSSVQFGRSVVSNSLQPHGLQHARPPCPSPTPRACSNSCPSSQWCHPTILFSVTPFSSCLQSSPASGSFPMSQLALHIRWPKYWSFSFSISPSIEYSGLISFRMDWFHLFLVQGTLKGLLQHHSSVRVKPPLPMPWFWPSKLDPQKWRAHH